VTSGSGILVDSNVLLDVLTRDAIWFDWSITALAEAANHARLVINPIVYAEISVKFESIEELEEALPRVVLEREGLPFEAAFMAGKAYASYRRKKGTKHSPIGDFLIGAHAAIRRYDLLTRDTGRYRTYFPSVRLIAPQ